MSMTVVMETDRACSSWSQAAPTDSKLLIYGTFFVANFLNKHTQVVPWMLSSHQDCGHHSHLTNQSQQLPRWTALRNGTRSLDDLGSKELKHIKPNHELVNLKLSSPGVGVRFLVRHQHCTPMVPKFLLLLTHIKLMFVCLFFNSLAFWTCELSLWPLHYLHRTGSQQLEEKRQGLAQCLLVND